MSRNPLADPTHPQHTLHPGQHGTMTFLWSVTVLIVTTAAAPGARTPDLPLGPELLFSVQPSHPCPTKGTGAGRACEQLGTSPCHTSLCAWPGPSRWARRGPREGGSLGQKPRPLSPRPRPRPSGAALRSASHLATPSFCEGLLWSPRGPGLASYSICVSLTISRLAEFLNAQGWGGCRPGAVCISGVKTIRCSLSLGSGGKEGRST